MSLESIVKEAYASFDVSESRISAALGLAQELKGLGWKFKISNERLICTTPEIEFYYGKDKASSRYAITLQWHASRYLVAVRNLDSQGWPSPHPHVSYEGEPCMGAQATVVYLKEPFIVAQTVANMLQGEIFPPSSFYRMNWFVPGEGCKACYERVSLREAVKQDDSYYHPNCIKEKR